MTYVEPAGSTGRDVVGDFVGNGRGGVFRGWEFFQRDSIYAACRQAGSGAAQSLPRRGEKPREGD